ncbi:MAG: hypothetical protein LLF82_000708 [Dehalococcoides mccartyi]|uniref:porin PorA family protein n=1 Tax=Dehalococcoides mccartyi TaxID=61435 RepID=UPI00242CE1B1|nr:porin PorA family protein [Dehalococcoides mccartyi]MCF7635226.1 hypothetical protein [Dehalococcoides mccartyi]MEA2121206.1 hypothetical protein [Dehalococcoides mccartyi]MEA2122266.1 hypothetical protein [Dehalococcoides mccartyi]
MFKRWWPSFLGALLVAAAFIWVYVFFPVMAKLPADYEQNYYFSGTVQVLNSATNQLNPAMPVNVTRALKASGLEDDVLLLDQKITFTHAQAGTELPFGSEEVYGLDRTTRANVAGYGDISRTGQFTFPADTQKQDYPFWSATANQSLTAKFVKEETYQGLTVYVFQVDQKNINLGTYANTGIPQSGDFLINIKVEPVSGVPVYSDTTTTLKISPAPSVSIPIFISTIAYTSETIDEMVSTAESTQSLIMWASVYAFWIVVGVGIVFIGIGFFRNRAA